MRNQSQQVLRRPRLLKMKKPKQLNQKKLNQHNLKNKSKVKKARLTLLKPIKQNQPILSQNQEIPKKLHQLMRKKPSKLKKAKLKQVTRRHPSQLTQNLKNLDIQRKLHQLILIKPNQLKLKNQANQINQINLNLDTLKMLIRLNLLMMKKVSQNTEEKRQNPQKKLTKETKVIRRTMSQKKKKNRHMAKNRIVQKMKSRKSLMAKNRQIQNQAKSTLQMILMMLNFCNCQNILSLVQPLGLLVVW